MSNVRWESEKTWGIGETSGRQSTDPISGPSAGHKLLRKSKGICQLRQLSPSLCLSSVSLWRTCVKIYRASWSGARPRPPKSIVRNENYYLATGSRVTSSVSGRKMTGKSAWWYNLYRSLSFPPALIRRHQFHRLGAVSLSSLRRFDRKKHSPFGPKNIERPVFLML